MCKRDILIDVSRLVWRFWRGGLPTGVDRVCLAYVGHFAHRAQAVVQRSGHFFILEPRHSEELFRMFSRGEPHFRRDLIKLASRALLAARATPAKKGLLYLNLGHTGLEDTALCRWIQKGDLRAVFLIHDLIPIVCPEYCRPGEAARHSLRMKTALGCARGLIGNSEETIRDIVEFARRERLRIPPMVAAPIAGPPIPHEICPRAFERPHFVTLGTIEGRKNHLLLLHIWKRLVVQLGAGVPLLVIIGQRGWEAAQTFALLDRAPDLKDHVRELGKCNDQDMGALLAGSRALLMPSFAEGFGLPILEALQLGVPVIASDLPVFREFAGDIPTYIDPLDGLSWQSAILDFKGDSPERARQERALRLYRGPNWNDHFSIVEDWLQSLGSVERS